jgi:diguanylate cyclase (GGDEF)-like protein
MKLGIGGRISLVVGLMLFLFFVTSAVSYVLTKRIEDNLARLASVDDLRQDAVDDMKFRLAEVSTKVLAYIVEGRPADKIRTATAAAQFDRSAETFMRLALSDDEVRLGGEVVVAFKQFVALSGEIMAAAERDRTALSGRITETGPSAARVGIAGAKLSILAMIDNDDVPVGLDVKRGVLLAKFESQRESVESLLDAQILPLVRAARAQTHQSANFSAYTAISYILVTTGLGVVIGGGGALVLARRVVRPIQELTAGSFGTGTLGSGKRAHRVAAESDDEIGELADTMIRLARMAENRQQTEQALRELAHHDSLTKLPNRTLFQIRLVESMDNATRIDRMVALHILDLDRFKEVNDTLGHRAGDMLLQQVAERLRGCLRMSDTVARLGGDEFAIIQTNLTNENDIPALAQRLNESLAAPFNLEGETIYTGASVGITVFPRDDTEVDALLKNADLALYRAKQEGGGTYQLYDSVMNAELQARKALEQDLRSGLEGSEFFVEYQPQIDLETGQVVGGEGLSRWRHPDRGLVAPDEFIPVAEQSGLINRLTERVLRDACTKAKAWEEMGLSRLRVSVNLSPADFKRKDVVPMITGIIDESGIDPGMLELEITEGLAMSGAESVISTLERLHALGVQLAIDDFGTGFSSMSYLKRFPVDRLKIDQTFVRDIVSNKEDASITSVIIDLGHSLGIKVVAEGVEDEAQLEFLASRKCDEAQGYHICAPVDADAFAEFAGNRAPRKAASISRIA